VPTSGDAFAMTVLIKSYTERKDAGRALIREIFALVQRQREVEVGIASISGFDLISGGERFGRDKYHYQTLLQRTAATHETNLSVNVTPLGAVSRLEHVLDGLVEERERYR
jgi:hypothetical protein